MLAEYFIGLVLYCCRERCRCAEAASGHDRSSHRHAGALEILKDVSQVQIPLTMVCGTFPVGLTDPLGPGKTDPSVVCGTSVGLPPFRNIYGTAPFSGLWNTSCETAPFSGLWNTSCETAPFSGLWNTSCETAPFSGLWNTSCGTI